MTTKVRSWWRAFGLQPHRTDTFKLSPDPLPIEKVRDIAGLYINPPHHALVLCVDEKSQLQALDRTRPLLPMQPGQLERGTHDYKRNGTTSLFAALDLKTSRVSGPFHQRHRLVEFRKFLDVIEAQVPVDLDVHLILDNYGTHKAEIIRNWLAKRPWFQVHFTPTYGSWLNLVERWFANSPTNGFGAGQLLQGRLPPLRDLHGMHFECEPNSLSVFSLRIASTATRALNLGLHCFRVVIDLLLCQRRRRILPYCLV